MRKTHGQEGAVRGLCSNITIAPDILGCLDVHLALEAFFEERSRCFQNTVKAFPLAWKAFELVDEVWLRELEDLTHVSGSDRMCVILYFSAHSRIRAAVEMAFSRCLPDAWASLRAGIESVAFASCIHQDVVLASRLDPNQTGEMKLKAFKHEFNDVRKKSLHPASKYGLKQLGRYWDQYSDSGSHATVGSLATRLTARVSGSTQSVVFHYLDAKKDVVLASLTDILMCCCVMEQVLFRDFEPRLHLDPQLAALRTELHDARRAAVEFLHRAVRLT